MIYAGKRLLLILLTVILTAGAEASQKQPISGNETNNQWQILQKGLAFGVFPAPRPSESGDSLVRVLRIDLKYFKLRLLNASASQHGRSLTAKEWCRRNGLVAAINASMYQKDLKASVSLMRTKSHVNNPRLSKDMTILAFDRKTSEAPPVKIIDRQCEDFNAWKKNYGSFVQSIRMISCTGANVWTQQPNKWSTAAIGIDHQGRILFIHVRSPYSTHDLINMLQELPLNISRAMYAEGGPEAQLYIRSGAQELEFVGSYEIDFRQSKGSRFARPVPNVLGISKRNAVDK
jgi:hypothetical protein